ncbi:MAG: DUF6029 family protein [Myxococcales bacterium]|nr:DUF6029 family protein [Myxococcales bacterium]
MYLARWCSIGCLLVAASIGTAEAEPSDDAPVSAEIAESPPASAGPGVETPTDEHADEVDRGAADGEANGVDDATGEGEAKGVDDATGEGEAKGESNANDATGEGEEDDDHPTDGEAVGDREFDELDPEPVQPALFSGSTTAVVEWRDDNRNGRDDDDNFGDAISRTDFSLDGGDTRVSMRIDGAAFVSPPPGGNRRNDLRIERVALELDRELITDGGLRAQLTLGDFYAQLGNGLALSVRRVDQLGIDIAVRGGRADLLLFDDAVTLSLLGGVTNPVNVEGIRLRYTDDPGDRMAAARIEGRLSEATVGVHAVTMRQERVAEGSPHPQTTNYGATLDLTVGAVGLSLEADGQVRDFGSQVATGQAVHGSATARVGPVTVLAEGKHYVQFESLIGSAASYLEDQFIYSVPPTVERIDQEVLDNTDITGGRLRVDLTTNQDTASMVYANLALFRNRLLGLWFAHGFGGVDQRWDSGAWLLISGGYRRETHADGGHLFRAIAHAELDFLVPLSSSYSLHLIGQHQSHVEPLGSTRLIFHRSNGSLELDITTVWTFTAGMDLNTQDMREEIRKVFAFGLVRFRPSDTFQVQLRAGSQRGGIRCIAGACRDMPSFSGLRLETTLRY